MRNIKVLFISNIPSPYRVDFFNELGKYCDLTVVFEKKASDERNSSWKNFEFKNFKGYFLNGKSVSVDSAFCPGILKFIKDKSYKKIICTTFTTPTGMLAIQYMKMHNIPYYLECDGGFPKDGRGLKERIKKHFISGAIGYFSTGKHCDDYYIAYGAKREFLIRYPFTSMYDDEISKTTLPNNIKYKIRKEKNIAEQHVVISVGRFSYDNGYGKGYDVLLKLAETMKTTGFYIIGDEPTEEFTRWKANKDLFNVHFVGYQNKSELANYYKSADVFVLMSRCDIWGLVINEAMSYGLPIITSDKCGAGQELVKNNKNGYIVPIDNIFELKEKINELLSDSNRCLTFGSHSLNIIKKYTIESMVKVHKNALLIE